MQQKLLGSRHGKIQLDHCYTAEGTYTIKMKIYSACYLFFLKKQTRGYGRYDLSIVTFVTPLV
jgi:hypothetical protein